MCKNMLPVLFLKLKYEKKKTPTTQQEKSEHTKQEIEKDKEIRLWLVKSTFTVIRVYVKRVSLLK